MKTIQQYTGTVVVGCVLACCLFQNVNAQIPPGGGGGGGTNTYNPPPDISNYLKYKAQSFLVLDTNAVASTDTNLFNALTAFPSAVGTNPVLQVLPYQNNCLLFKASHFDYSGESSRHFCLVVNDKVDFPLYKNINLSSPTNNIQNGGWLVQGSLPPWEVSDTMFLMVSNTSRIYNGFFRVIPYGGAQIQLTGAQPYDVVSNTVSLQAIVTDLSGITNELFELTADGSPVRYSLGASNTINIETKYNPNGLNNIYLNTINRAVVFDPTNPPANSQTAKTYFSASASLSLDFENDTYLAFASDNCPPEVGTNNIYFVIDKAQQIDVTISKPSNGQTVAHFAGNVPYPTTIVIPWNMTEADHVTPYSNDTYVVTFIAYDPTTITITNTLDKGGNIRNPGGCLLTYQWEDPALPDGQWVNDRADQVIKGDLRTLYGDIYKPLSLTQYSTGDVGPYRNRVFCDPYDSYSSGWASIMGRLHSTNYSELTIAQAHGSGSTVGGGYFLTDLFNTLDMQSWVKNCEDSHHWRLRKATIFTCYSGDWNFSTANGQYSSWADACGVRPESLQIRSLTYKNCALLFAEALQQKYYDSELSIVRATADVAEFVDQTWVCGKNQYPGGCDPNYSWRFACQVAINRYEDLPKALPSRVGYAYCVYNSNQDVALRNLDTSGVKER